MQPVNSPARWNLTVSNACRSEWIDFSGGISKFLTAVFLEGFRIPFFPPDFPSNNPTFHTYPSVEELRTNFSGKFCRYLICVDLAGSINH
jgi:hypothetical protein